MLVEDLQELGLKENEAKIYLALLEIGASTTGPIIKKSGLYRVMVYDTLEKLMKLGLVNYSLSKNRKVFEAEQPQQVMELIKNKQMLAEKVVANLNNIPTPQHHDQGAFIFEGWRGIKAAQEHYFKEMKPSAQGEYLMVGASRGLHKKLDAFFNYFHERRSKMKIPAKLLFNENNKRFGNLKKKFKPIQVKYMPKKILTPSWISMYGDMVLIGVAEENPTAFFIKNKAVAESYKQYFYSMWEQGKN
ncbi:MAG: helix-turn-helix domain-containing protein [Candidatus Woesearchaeota archaeon]|jgi:sugar-specific transcriptional regulator TrmB|nr:helix-turn-helix domain-containing protein [Candidatus Woesearchaeota archaeon]MDP7457712.1 helix-turn-helix domain-containing protein [Candidatus Woesearchaeota archaeon]